MFYMPPNVKFISVRITSSISNACLRKVVGMAKNNENTNCMFYVSSTSRKFGIPSRDSAEWLGGMCVRVNFVCRWGDM